MIAKDLAPVGICLALSDGVRFWRARTCYGGVRGWRGGGGKKAEETQPGLRSALKGLAEAATRGDPMADVTWCSVSLRDLERQLAVLGFRCGKDAVARMLRAEGCSLQAMAKVLEGKQ